MVSVSRADARLLCKNTMIQALLGFLDESGKGNESHVGHIFRSFGGEIFKYGIFSQ